MIVFGSRTKNIKTEFLPVTCANCGCQDTVHLHVYQKYAHVFWIPFIPLKKVAASECHHCKLVQREMEFPGMAGNTFKNIKSRTKTPIWTYTGAILMTAFISFLAVNGPINESRKQRMLAEPHTGDIYEIKTKSSGYTLFKVAFLSHDTIFVRLHSMGTNRPGGLSSLKKSEDWSSSIEPITKQQLVELATKGTIIAIDRI